MNSYRWTVHFEIYVVHLPTNALFINLVKSFKFTLKYTIISLLHVSVFNDHHQGALSVCVPVRLRLRILRDRVSILSKLIGVHLTSNSIVT